MKMYTYSEARQRLAEVLNEARTEDVIISRRGGDRFVLSYQKTEGSPLDVPVVRTRATTADVVRAVRESRKAR
ncbi:MAG: type II toxin-antitoxin system prevent-host-death family antitoxin [Candidatus Hydrogenedens sp.]|nr:type II toxin-antitoxin system prevent-host-death family antitoxin [Candidatus Hydrogenedens sp.]